MPSAAAFAPYPPVPGTLVTIEAGRAAEESEACLSAAGGLAGNPDAPLACQVGERHRLRVGEVLQAALATGHAGAILRRPDAPLVEGLLGAGFCPDCQAKFQRRLVRKYGEQFQPVDYLALTRVAVAGASGALSVDTLPFGRDFWRFRHEALERAVRAHVRSAHDAARSSGLPFTLCGWFEALGPSQLAAARHLDVAVFPVLLAGVPLAGRFELLRGALVRRAVAVEPPPDAPPAAWLRLASLAAPYGIALAGAAPGGEAGAVLAGIRALVHEVAARGGAPSLATPLAECAVLYSAEADLWSAGRHRHAVEVALQALASRRLQATVALHPAEVPLATPLVLADTEPPSRSEARELAKRRSAGGAVLTLAGPDGDGQVEKIVDAHFPVARRAVMVGATVPVLAAVRSHGNAVDVHLATSWPERATRVRLRLPLVAVRGARKGRFRCGDGADVRVRFTVAGDAVTVELPTFTGYAVLTPET